MDGGVAKKPLSVVAARRQSRKRNGGKNMIRKRFGLTWIALAIAGVTCRPSEAQTPTVIQIDIENYAYYYADNPDYNKLAGSAQAVPPVSTKTFSSFIGLADIVRVNGASAKGTWSIRATTTNYTPTPQPGQAIADTTRNFFVDWVWEIQQADGTPVGTIMATGMGFGPPPPGSPAGLSPTAASSMAITGGTGAYLGIRGQAGFSQITVTGRAASVAEDPSMRRVLGGGTRSFLLTLIPLAPPTILSNSSGPLVLHAIDFSQVTAANPARPGEILSIIATGLGPTNSGGDSGQPFPVSPLAVVNSPVAATLNGSPADILYAGGYPGTTATYQVNLRLPASAQPGMAALQITSAWQASAPVQLVVGVGN
jgi:hypothetical protein